MGQKVHPIAVRLGVNKPWKASWYVKKDEYANNVIEDMKIRKYLEDKLTHAGLSSIKIKRFSKKVEINIIVARPGVVIGRGGSGIEKIKKDLSRKFSQNIELKVFEVKNPDVDSKVIASNIINQLERRIVPKFACQRAIESAQSTSLVKGIRIWVSGRIKGAEIARTEKYQWGTVPLQTLRANIDYTYMTAQVPNAGKQGVKVWIYKGEKHDYEID